MPRLGQIKEFQRVRRGVHGRQDAVDKLHLVLLFNVGHHLDVPVLVRIGVVRTHRRLAGVGDVFGRQKAERAGEVLGRQPQLFQVVVARGSIGRFAHLLHGRQQ
jgi:hypothetical protein